MVRKPFFSSPAGRIVLAVAGLAVADTLYRAGGDFSVAWARFSEGQGVEAQVEAVAVFGNLLHLQRGRYPEQAAVEPLIQAQLANRFDRDPLIDKWGVPLRIRFEESGWEVRSCGADQECGTSDDVSRRGLPPHGAK